VVQRVGVRLLRETEAQSQTSRRGNLKLNEKSGRNLNERGGGNVQAAVVWSFREKREDLRRWWTKQVVASPVVSVNAHGEVDQRNV
jgi:hypothetical protein